MKNQTFIFIGRSGSGKGTQLELLKAFLSKKDDQLNIETVIMGELFREFFKTPGFIQNIAQDITTKHGKFQPNFLTDTLFINKIINVLKENQVLFLDGYPRNIHQLNVIKELFLYIKRDNPIVINIDVSRESVKKRMIDRGRSDDNNVAIDNRLNEYDKYIIPMIDLIKNDSFFEYLEVDGEGSRDDIHFDIINKIKNHID
jgi:adenylate kinase family enzyme